MVGTAHADGREPPRHDVRNMRRLWQNHGDGAGRKRREKMRRGGCDDARRIRRHGEVGDMQDERVIGRTPLRRVDARTSRHVQPVRPEPVDRLGRKCDERAVTNHLRGMCNVRIAYGRYDLRLHGAFLLSECVAVRIKRCSFLIIVRRTYYEGIVIHTLIARENYVYGVPRKRRRCVLSRRLASPEGAGRHDNRTRDAKM